jgi:transcriptional regulator of acetoin/glycerol metabolism
MTAICEKAEDCLAHGLPMLVQGETGTGKSALVAALLDGSYRVLTVDCALLEDTEDDRAYVGSLIEQLRALDALNFEADMRSALVLENVNELPAYAQSALRNLLDDFERRSDRTNNALQVTSTCRSSLKASLDQGHFRDDLFYMLSGIPLVLPPLRERNKRLDLVQSLANVLAGQDVGLSAEAKGAILAYHWPGNVRELRNVLQRALVCGNGSIITSVDLGLTDESFDLPSPAKPRDIDEKSIVLDALNSAQWNVSKAARSMGIGRATLHRKMKMHRISRPT